MDTSKLGWSQGMLQACGSLDSVVQLRYSEGFLISTALSGLFLAWPSRTKWILGHGLAGIYCAFKQERHLALLEADLHRVPMPGGSHILGQGLRQAQKLWQP